MKEYIDVEKFYEEAVKREKRAYQHLMELDLKNDKNEWIKWNIRLNERTSFKHDIMDFEKADVKEVKYAKWIEDGYYGGEIVCSNCGTPAIIDANIQIVESFYCPFCGAKMNKEHI